RVMMRTIALLTAATVAAIAAGTAGARSTDVTISGAGSTFVQPLVSQWTQPLGSAYGYSLQHSGIGSGGAHAARTAPPPALRATRACRGEARPATRRSVQGVQRVRPDPLGALGDVGDLQPGRSQEPPPHGRADARTHLLRRHHAVGRPGDQEAEQGRQPAEHE